MRKALIVGGDGLIGGALLAQLRADGIDAVATTRRAGQGHRRVLLDLAAPEKWPSLSGFDLAFLCAAETSIARCAETPAATRAVNVCATARLAEALASRGVFVVVPSTNAVFDGTQPYRAAEEPRCPVTEYGRQKSDLEERVLSARSMAVLRLTKVFGPWPALLAGWRERWSAGRSVEAFSDMVVAPVTADLAARAMVAIAVSESPGVFQLSADVDVSYFDVARHLARRQGIPAILVRPARAANRGIDPAAPPKHTTLDTGRLRDEFGIEAPQVWSVIDTVTS